MKAKEIDKAVRQAFGTHNNNLKALDQIQKKQKLDDAPVVVEEVTENVLINIPDDIPMIELGAVLCALHYYQTTAQIKAAAWSSFRRNYKRNLTLHVHVSCNNEKIQEIITRTLDLPVFRRDSIPVPLYTYDMYCSFDDKTVNNFRSNRKFHASSAYGVILGCEAQSLFDIPVEKIIKDVVDNFHVSILVIDDEHGNYEKVWKWIGETVPALIVSRLQLDMHEFTAMIAAINNSDMIVGPSSLYTYLACCMRKPVFEIYPTDISRNWLSKWSNDLYSMYVSTVDDLDKDTLLKGVSWLWKRMSQSKLQAQEALGPVETLTVQLP